MVLFKNCLPMRETANGWESCHTKTDSQGSRVHDLGCGHLLDACNWTVRASASCPIGCQIVAPRSQCNASVASLSFPADFRGNSGNQQEMQFARRMEESHRRVTAAPCLVILSFYRLPLAICASIRPCAVPGIGCRVSTDARDRNEPRSVWKERAIRTSWLPNPWGELVSVHLSNLNPPTSLNDT